MKRRRSLDGRGLDQPAAITFFAVLCAASLFCAGNRRERPPNVVLVIIDTLRADATSPYHGCVRTPAFDELARRGALFERAYAPTPETAPSHASLFTGQEDLRHGVTRNGVPLSQDSETLAERFRAQGYATAGFVSSWVMDPRFGWAQGFDVYDADFPEEGATMDKERNAYPGAIWQGRDFGGLDRRCSLTTDRALAWLDGAREPLFLFIHYFDPHAPYVPPRENLPRLKDAVFDTQGRSFQGLGPAQLLTYIRLYHGEVLSIDETLLDLIRGLEEKSPGYPTLVVVTADHGEGLGQHGWMEHSVYLYDEQIHVPLVFLWLGEKSKPVRIGTPVSLVDVAPTVLELAGLPVPRDADGRSLATSITGGDEPQSRPLFGHRRRLEEEYPVHLEDLFSVRTRQWKLVRGREGSDELYDLVNDPRETQNLAGVYTDTAAHLASLLEAHLAAMPEPQPPPPLTEEEREKLKALGYGE